MESVKAASELYCPVSGKVIEKNAAVEETPSLINSSCYEKGGLPAVTYCAINSTSIFPLIAGWLFKVELTNEDDLKALMTEKQYQEFLKTHDNH